jgi:predicted nucleic acid-binding protein
MPPVGPPILVDANVLIDYAKVDLGILGLVSASLGEVRVAAEVVHEVRDTDAAACQRTGLVVVEATMDQIVAAGRRRPGLSFEDHLCLVLARDAGGRCLTNDRVLRAACVAEGVPCIWGLQILLDLVRARALNRSRADRVAAGIRATNPLHISAGILDEFRKKLEAAP